MEKVITFTYSRMVHDDRLLELSQDSAVVYNKAIDAFNSYVEKNGKWPSSFSLQKEMSTDYKRTFLHSDSYIAALQQYHAAMVSCKEAIKIYNKCPSKFTGAPKYPSKRKHTNVITFKQSAIRVKKGYLLLSLARGLDPIKIKWNEKLSTPTFARIGYYPTKGWMGHFVFEKTVKQIESIINSDSEDILAIDLGIKRIATAFDGTNCITYSGKKIRSLIRHREKVKSDYQSLMSTHVKHSKRWKRLNSAKRKSIKTIQDKINDILHKTSRTIVNYAIEHKIPKIVVGDNASTHDSPDKGKENNQLITQGVEQKLLQLVQYKFESIGGTVEIVPEYYTSKTCPRCSTMNESKKRNKKNKDGTVTIISDRAYNCKECKLEYDRDGIGSINIWGLGKNVSLGSAYALLGVIGALTVPIGWKYHSSHKCVLDLRK